MSRVGWLAKTGLVEPNSVFQRLFKKDGCVRLLDAFLEWEGARLTQRELEAHSGVDQGTVSRRVRELEQWGLIERLDDTWPVQFRLDAENPIVAPLRDAHFEFVRHGSAAVDVDGAAPTDSSPFVQAFDAPSHAAILDALLTWEGARLSVREIAEEAGLDRSTVYSNIDHLRDIGLVEKSESASGDRYRLAEDHPATDPLYELHFEFQRYLSETDTHLPEDDSATAAQSLREPLTEQLEAVNDPVATIEAWTEHVDRERIQRALDLGRTDETATSSVTSSDGGDQSDHVSSDAVEAWDDALDQTELKDTTPQESSTAYAA